MTLKRPNRSIHPKASQNNQSHLEEENKVPMVQGAYDFQISLAVLAFSELPVVRNDGTALGHGCESGSAITERILCSLQHGRRWQCWWCWWIREQAVDSYE